MELATGYVPREWVAASTEMENTHGGTGWDGTTPTVNHPRNRSEFSWHDPERPEDDIVLAANEDVQETLGVGVVENDRFDGEYVRADIAINADETRGMGGEAADIVDDIEADRGLEVSSQYLHAELPPGEYDGEYRTNAKAIAAPDSVALIPNGRGVCSIDEGCGIAPGVTANIADHPGVGDLTAGPDDPGNSGEGQRTMDNGSQMAGVRQLLSGIASLLPAAGPTDETTKSQTANTPDGDPRGGDDSGGESDSDESAESDTDDDTTANTSMKDNKREELIRFITANSELNEDSLEHMGDTCLQNTHEMVVANAADGGSDGSDADGGDDDDDGTDDDDDSDADDDGDVDDTGGDTIADMTADELGAELRDQGFVTEDSIGEQVETAANQRKKEERAKTIVANSAEYGEDDVEWIADLPEKELERKERGATQTGGVPAPGGAFGATGNAGGDVDVDDMPDLEVE